MELLIEELAGKKLSDLDPETLARLHAGPLGDVNAWVFRSARAKSQAGSSDPFWREYRPPKDPYLAARANLLELVNAELGPHGRRHMRRNESSRYKDMRVLADYCRKIGGLVGKTKPEAGAIARVILLAQLKSKELGPLESQTIARIQQASVEELETWTLRMLDATSLDDVFGP